MLTETLAPLPARATGLVTSPGSVAALTGAACYNPAQRRRDMSWIDFEWMEADGFEGWHDLDCDQDQQKQMELGWLYEPEHDEYPGCFCRAIKITSGDKEMILDCRYTSKYLLNDAVIGFSTASSAGAYGSTKKAAIAAWTALSERISKVAEKRRLDARMLLESIDD